jgi:ribosomal protein L2
MQPGLELKAFRVFNRWGELVFEEKEHLLAGMVCIKMSAQPVGVYVYYVEVKNLSTGKTNMRSGNVTLIAIRRTSSISYRIAHPLDFQT